MPDHIFDTTVLSNLGAVGRVDLLAERYHDTAFTTVEVIDELRKGIQAGYGYLDKILQQVDGVAQEGWLRILMPESVAEHRLRAEFDLVLQSGEASCLALALSRGMVLVTDDLAARRLATERGVLLSGTLGIFNRTCAKRNDLAR